MKCLFQHPACVVALLAMVFTGCDGKKKEHDSLVLKKDELHAGVNRLSAERARQTARMDKLREELGAAARLDAEGKLDDVQKTLREMEEELAVATAERDALKASLETLESR